MLANYRYKQDGSSLSGHFLISMIQIHCLCCSSRRTKSHLKSIFLSPVRLCAYVTESWGFQALTTGSLRLIDLTLNASTSTQRNVNMQRTSYHTNICPKIWGHHQAVKTMKSYDMIYQTMKRITMSGKKS